MEKLADSLIQKLIHLPETGMGYQIVEARYKDLTTTRDCIVLNGSIVQPIVVDLQETMKSIFNEDLDQFMKSASYSSRIVDVQLKSLPYLLKSASFKESESASGASLSEAKKYEAFIRFSRFLNDYRITKEKGLVPGTYATTYEDAKYCMDNKINPVARYALPSNKPAEYAFKIEPPEKTPVRRGTVQPANGQPGGGKEIIFVNGSPPHTVTKTYFFQLGDQI